MKPIDVLTSLPRSPEIARVVAAQGRHAEVQAQNQIASFARELSHKDQSVGEAVKTVTENNVDDESPGEGGAYYGQSGGKGDGKPDKDHAAPQHPSKGKVLDIKGDLNS